MCSTRNTAVNRRAKMLVLCATIALILTGIAQTLCADEAIGWRNNGKGEFVADVPVRWSREDGVAWKTKLPATSISSPVVVNDRAFVMAEPNRLLCLRLSNGELVWDRPHEYADIFDAEQTNEIQKQHAESRRIRQRMAELEKDLKSAQESKASSDDVSTIQEQIRKLSVHDEKLTVIPPPQTDATGNTASTPVCDDENVYTVLGNGIVSSHRLDGTRNWIRFIGKPMSRHSASPLIAGNLLIIHLQHLVAVDRGSGEVVWKTDTPARNGTPTAFASGEQTVIVTPAGAVIRANNGTVLAKGLFDLAYCSPIAKDGVVYAAERGRLLAIKITSDDDSSAIQTETLWQTRGAQDDRLASPVVHGQLLFVATGNGILDVIDTANGKIVKRKRLDLGDGRVDASLSLVDGHIYVQNTNGTTVVVRPTSDCTEVARNKGEGSSSSPFFVDERILFRTPTHLICVGGRHSQAARE